MALEIACAATPHSPDGRRKVRRLRIKHCKRHSWPQRVYLLVCSPQRTSSNKHSRCLIWRRTIQMCCADLGQVWCRIRSIQSQMKTKKSVHQLFTWHPSMHLASLRTYVDVGDITFFFPPRTFVAAWRSTGTKLFYWAASRHRLFLYWPISRCAWGREGISPDLPLPGWQTTGWHGKGGVGEVAEAGRSPSPMLGNRLYSFERNETEQMRWYQWFGGRKFYLRQFGFAQMSPRCVQ